MRESWLPGTKSPASLMRLWRAIRSLAVRSLSWVAQVSCIFYEAHQRIRSEQSRDVKVEKSDTVEESSSVDEVDAWRKRPRSYRQSQYSYLTHLQSGPLLRSSAWRREREVDCRFHTAAFVERVDVQ